MQKSIETTLVVGESWIGPQKGTWVYNHLPLTEYHTRFVQNNCHEASSLFKPITETIKTIA